MALVKRAGDGVHCYAEDGRKPVDNEVSMEGVEDGALSLVNLADDHPHFFTPSTTPLHAYVTKEESYPAGANPFHYDLSSMGTTLVRGRRTFRHFKRVWKKSFRDVSHCAGNATRRIRETGCSRCRTGVGSATT
jgi:hypothetical protein